MWGATHRLAVICTGALNLPGAVARDQVARTAAVARPIAAPGPRREGVLARRPTAPLDRKADGAAWHDYRMDLVLPVGPRDHVRGPRDAAVTVVMYGDVECPYCGRVELVLRQLLDRRPELRLVFRHFPLVDVHPSAYSAALALEAAAEAGRFWELHDLLYADQEHQGRRQLATYAVQLGLDPDSLLRPATERYDQRVRDDYDSGVASGVEGTPALFVDGLRFQGGPSLARLEAAVDGALA